MLLIGNSDNDPLFFQVKQGMPVPARTLSPKVLEEFSHQGNHIVTGQRALQASTDVMLGWTSIGKTPFYVRQMKNMKGSIPVEWLSGSSFNSYAWGCGAILRRAHCPQRRPRCLAGYCGKSSRARRPLWRSGPRPTATKPFSTTPHSSRPSRTMRKFRRSWERKEKHK